MMGPLKPCAQPGCPKLAVRCQRFCEAHSKDNYVLEGNRQKGSARYHNTPWASWYQRFPWTGPNGLRYVTLARDPICKICNRAPSTVADHIVPYKGIWDLFTDLSNLQGICAPCHDRKTALEDGGFGNVRKE